jgi:HAD superfamily hydrolase (TIGR01509 family)
MVGMAANALIFDLDGTIWDSADWFATALSQGDSTAADAARAQLIGGGNIIRALGEAGISRAQLLSEAGRSGPPPLFPGMREALEKLARRGVPMAVATSLPGTLATPMLASANLGAVFSVVVHAGTCRTPKPHPRSIHMALEMLGVQASPESFYIGDRKSDAEAATRAGISFAWVMHGYERPAADSGIRALSPEELLEL